MAEYDPTSWLTAVKDLMARIKLDRDVWDINQEGTERLARLGDKRRTAWDHLVKDDPW